MTTNQNAKDDIKILEAVVTELLKINIQSGSVEWPGYLQITENDGRVYAFGFAEDVLGWDTEGGRRGGECPSITWESSAKDIALAISAVLDAEAKIAAKGVVPGF